jgi:tetratricopeptide (TPR) repeat protein
MQGLGVALLACLSFAVLAVRFAAPARAEDLPDFDELWNYGDPAGTEAKFRAVLPQAEASGNGEYTAQLWTQIARTYGLRGEFVKAHETLDKVDAGLKPAWKTARVRSLLERGRAFNSAKRKDEARPLFLRAWEEARVAGLDEHACDAAHMMGIVESGETGVEWTSKALALAEASKEPKAARWVGALCQNLGYAHQEKGEHEKALAYFRKGLAWSLERKRSAQARIFKWFIGKSQRLTGDLDGALATQKEVARESEAAGDKDGFSLEEIAETLTAQGKPAEAKPYFAEAYALLKDDPEIVGDPKRRERLRTLGGVAEAK